MLVRTLMFCFVLSCIVLFCIVLYCPVLHAGSSQHPNASCILLVESQGDKLHCFLETCFVVSCNVLCCCALNCAVPWALQPISLRFIYNLPLRCRLMLFYTEIYCPEVSYYVLIYSLLYRCIVADISRHLSGR